MKKISLLLVACLLVSLLPFAAVAEGASGPVITVTVPADFEGELNGRLLFCVDTAMPREGRNVYSNLDVTGCEVVGKTVFGLHAGDTITLTADDPDAYGYPYTTTVVVPTTTVVPAPAVVPVTTTTVVPAPVTTTTVVPATTTTVVPGTTTVVPAPAPATTVVY